MVFVTATTTMLAYIPSPSQGVWELGPVPLRAYALCIIAGIIVAVFWGNRRWVARGGNNGEVLDVAIWAVPFGLIGGRIYHVLTDWPTYFGDGPKEPIDALKVWDGGLGIWGAVAFGAVGAWIGARQLGIKLPAFGDAIAPPILLAQAIGRLGNYFNQELYGRETTVPWGLEIFNRRNDAGAVGPNVMDGVSTGDVVTVVHPTFLYEMLWSLLVVVLLVVVDRQFRIGHGRLFALYVAGYCVGRFGVELMRDDHATLIAGVRINVFTAALVFIGAAIYFVIAPKGRELGLSMFHPDRAEELEELGEVGYVDEFDDSDYPDDPDEKYSDDDTADEGADRSGWSAPTAVASGAAATAVLDKTRNESAETDEAEPQEDEPAEVESAEELVEDGPAEAEPAQDDTTEAATRAPEADVDPDAEPEAEETDAEPAAEDTDAAASEIEDVAASELESESEPDSAEVNIPEVDDAGTDDAGTDDVGTDDVGTDDAGTDGAGTDDAGSDGAGTDKDDTGSNTEDRTDQ